MLKKFWIHKQFQNKPEKIDFFKYISSTKKNPEQFEEFKEFQKNWAPWNFMYGIPPTKGSPNCFGNFFPIKPNLNHTIESPMTIPNFQMIHQPWLKKMHVELVKVTKETILM